MAKIKSTISVALISPDIYRSAGGVTPDDGNIRATSFSLSVLRRLAPGILHPVGVRFAAYTALRESAVGARHTATTGDAASNAPVRPA
jgi:hypothetical protein